jgi:hypothetical protein
LFEQQNGDNPLLTGVWLYRDAGCATQRRLRHNVGVVSFYVKLRWMSCGNQIITLCVALAFSPGCSRMRPGLPNTHTLRRAKKARIKCGQVKELQLETQKI